MTPTNCIYHSRDLDGWTSAAIIQYKYPDVKLIGYDYGQAIPKTLVKGPVIMVDVAFPMEEMYKLSIEHELIWIDHHISSIKEYFKMQKTVGNFLEPVLDPTRAACESAWEYIFPDKPMPEPVRLLGMYDSFRHKKEKETWETIENFEGLYEVSNHGNVRSIDRVIIEKNTFNERHISGKNLSKAIGKRGYYIVTLYKNNLGITIPVHRLVSTAFIPNPENKPAINHKDLNRLNNYYKNLEWVTVLENNLHSIENGGLIKPVIQLDFNDNYIASFASIKEAEKVTGIHHTNISTVCKGKRELAGGYKWEYGKKEYPSVDDEELKVLKFQYYARSIASDPNEAAIFISDLFDMKKAMIGGDAIYQYLCVEAEGIYRKGFPMEFDGHVFIAFNRERFNPVNFGINYHSYGWAGSVCFWYSGNDKWTFSLYNDDGKVDCSEICKKRGGGGHKGAAGFVVNTKELIMML